MQKQEAQFKAAELEFHEQQLQHVSEEQRQAEELIQNSLDSGGWYACLLCHLDTSNDIVIMKHASTLVIIADLPAIARYPAHLLCPLAPQIYFCSKHTLHHTRHPHLDGQNKSA